MNDPFLDRHILQAIEIPFFWYKILLYSLCNLWNVFCLVLNGIESLQNLLYRKLYNMILLVHFDIPPFYWDYLISADRLWMRWKYHLLLLLLCSIIICFKVQIIIAIGIVIVIVQEVGSGYSNILESYELLLFMSLLKKSLFCLFSLFCLCCIYFYLSFLL